jgi:hypothetical protein
VCQWLVPHIALEGLARMAHLLDSPVHELLCLENLSGRNLHLLMLRRGNLRRQRLTLSKLLRHPLHAVVHFLPLILIGPNGKFCTLSLWRRASLILPDVSDEKMLDVLCLYCNCLDSCFICIVLCAFVHVYVLFCLYLFSSRVSVFATSEQILCHLRALFDLFIAN